ncbi:MAG: Holliday junction resolvase RuvX [Alphaproteobacteria bacterium]
MIDRLENIYESCPQGVRLLGMDIGKKTIGLALADNANGISTPLMTVRRTKFSQDIKQLERVIRDYEVGGYIIGYPLHMDGSEGARCQSVRDFSHEFERQISADLKQDQGLWIALYDERLSTASVEDLVDYSVGISRRSAKARGLTDQLAAQVILQSALDFMQQCC